MKLFATAWIGVVISTSAVSGMLQGDPGNDIARSNLPPCLSFSYFHNCFGTYIDHNNGRKYVGEWKDGKWNGQGNLNFSNGDNYVGGFKDDKRNGQGRLYFGNGTRYFGEWKDDKRNGQGTLTFADSTKYVGEFKDGLFNGQGTYTYADGKKYVGEHTDGKQNGQGTFTLPSGEKYVGEFKDGLFNGQGTSYSSNGSISSQGIWADGKLLRSAPVQQTTVPVCQGSDASRWSYCFGSYTSADGTKYVGEWKDGKQNGQGTNSYVGGAKYVGEWKDGKWNGQGNLNFSNGDNYVGGFKDNKFNGQGTFTSPNGTKYVGEWKDGKQNGQATCTYANGNKYVGEWKDGKENGQGTYTFTNGDIYVGGFKDEELHGQGTFTFANGTKFIGQFRDSKRNGQGTETFANGSKYFGEYKDDRQNGQGTVAFADGEKYVGEFKDGKQNGQGTLYTSNGLIASQGIWADGKLVRSAPVQTATVPNQEVERLKAEAAEAKRKQAEAEEGVRVAQQQASQTKQPSPVTAQSATPISRRVALVVGNKNYKVRPLQNSLNDADDISASLRTSGFDVIDIRDATLPQMRTAVRQFGDKLLTHDVGLVYYSGHGVEVKGRNYFIPVNADIQREDEIADQGLDVSLILEKMSTAGKGVNILIVDACRDDPFGRSFRSTSRGLAQMDAPRGTIIAYATSPGKVASDGDPSERNSPYTKNLVKAMQAPNKPIEQVFKEVRRAVQDETKNQQTPWENTSLSGDFFFKVQR